jgi:hypothetical protein
LACQASIVGIPSKFPRREAMRGSGLVCRELIELIIAASAEEAT